jgi:hypothetical protein
VRALVARIPERLLPRPARTVGVAAVDADGSVVRRAWGEIDGVPVLSGVRERGGVLWLGNLLGRGIASLAVAGQPAAGP